MKVVLDTNIFISAFLFGGLPRRCLKRCISGDDILFISSEILDEISGVLSRPKFGLSQDMISCYINAVAEVGILQALHGTIHICRDPKDDMFLDCAVHAGAQYLITGDEDLLILNRSGSCSIVTPSEYLSVVHDL
jgi:uncharacterized protein